jgi:3'-phosphoadenosine 5'-phosphosulfate sulfotransferase (PAPS reductase)/FAD synthetase
MKKKYKNLNQDQFSYDKEKEIRCINGKDSILISPIIDWTERDVWEFLNEVVKVPHCELYDKGYKRIGCILCPMSNPKQKRREMQDFPYVKEKWLQAIEKIRSGGQELHSGIISEKIHRVGAFYRESEWGGESLRTQSNGKPSIGSEQQLQRKSGGWRKDNRGIWKGDFP